MPKKEMCTTHFQLMQLLQLAITSSTYLFDALIAVDGISCDSGPSTCGHNKDALKSRLIYLKISAKSRRQLLSLALPDCLFSFIFLYKRKKQSGNNMRLSITSLAPGMPDYFK